MTTNLDRLADLIAETALPLEPGESMQISVDPWFECWSITITQRAGAHGSSAMFTVDLPYNEEQQ